MTGPERSPELGPEQRARNRRASCLTLFVIVTVAALSMAVVLVTNLRRG